MLLDFSARTVLAQVGGECRISRHLMWRHCQTKHKVFEEATLWPDCTAQAPTLNSQEGDRGMGCIANPKAALLGNLFDGVPHGPPLQYPFPQTLNRFCREEFDKVGGHV
jgi:hypothetical protein